MLNNFDAIAHVKGSNAYPKIEGTVGFKGVKKGTWVDVDVKGLPDFEPGNAEQPQTGPHGFHIHVGNQCGSGHEDGEEGEGAFAAAGGHWNPDNQPHGNHKGDMPALFSNHGVSKMVFFTDRFQPEEIVGKTVIIHRSPDDYRGVASGNTGERIACGKIEKATDNVGQ